MPAPPTLARTTIRTVCPPRAAVIRSVEVVHAPTRRCCTGESPSGFGAAARCLRVAEAAASPRAAEDEAAEDEAAAVLAAVRDSAWTGAVGSAAVPPLTARARAAMVNR
ncbi:hypothetical protein Misp03_03240 [Microbispora sp. NBRC 16548]|nr:hypothetical protein Misp03_03240 [Microbispora sp. NBRC 16548]